MSRIGKRPIVVPSGVKVDIKKQNIHVEGPKGKMDMEAHYRMAVTMKEDQIEVKRPTDSKQDRSLHGLTRSLIANMVQGVKDEFSKTLEIEGLGFKAEIKGKNLQLTLGFSHPIIFVIPEGIKIETPKPTIVVVKGIDKHLVGQAAANIRAFYKPEPYKGKGIRYAGEQIRRKAGKSAG
ncbi:MAG: 50S ribosomal protein L6 [Omnitrophica bacterium RIFCSPLOWO2_12_FULL_44_17]|uniref:Large ribosomal subunit protein uL6 n=1 Tax=Candidatus Danuiimicrobium aquiferis TaxID=1801832 RepID=A0A1G1L0R9_9BACT|nr:MAG: 50S ribosomal protein L6 [Omnitrophica bacterium RIFCSPHIGHO2_02_FULL_45_28]OGW91775.1 MAG: 50S ribosomal protein L6 [Omnitrophica bacterium RIFCSPHIGHO2_12_FULL_44_12]OGW98479.1 MAG: 50S ribosomal protein L6 [Omnitrophica bacterium RIFCSPLOWO2_12_FULL_44_17]OGX02926.1 MAG: 50S ribosomal protein L6 [Omnitrophica bacterium RIFCSPLOWO2_02_FULL_44_11]